MDGVAQRKRHPPQRGVRSFFSTLLGSSSVPAAVSMTLSRPFVPRWRVQPFRDSFVLISPFMWKYACLPLSMFSMLIVANLSPSTAFVSSI